MGECTREFHVWRCEECEYEWIGKAKAGKRPRACPGCGSLYWYAGKKNTPMILRQPKRRPARIYRPRGLMKLPATIPPEKAGIAILRMLKKIEEEQSSISET